MIFFRRSPFVQECEVELVRGASHRLRRNLRISSICWSCDVLPMTFPATCLLAAQVGRSHIALIRVERNAINLTVDSRDLYSIEREELVSLPDMLREAGREDMETWCNGKSVAAMAWMSSLELLVAVSAGIFTLSFESEGWRFCEVHLKAHHGIAALHVLRMEAPSITQLVLIFYVSGDVQVCTSALTPIIFFSLGFVPSAIRVQFLDSPSPQRFACVLHYAGTFTYMSQKLELTLAADTNEVSDAAVEALTLFRNFDLLDEYPSDIVVGTQAGVSVIGRHRITRVTGNVFAPTFTCSDTFAKTKTSNAVAILGFAMHPGMQFYAFVLSMEGSRSNYCLLVQHVEDPSGVLFSTLHPVLSVAGEDEKDVRLAVTSDFAQKWGQFFLTERLFTSCVSFAEFRPALSIEERDARLNVLFSRYLELKRGRVGMKGFMESVMCGSMTGRDLLVAAIRLVPHHTFARMEIVAMMGLHRFASTKDSALRSRIAEWFDCYFLESRSSPLADAEFNEAVAAALQHQARDHVPTLLCSTCDGHSAPMAASLVSKCAEGHVVHISASTFDSVRWFPDMDNAAPFDGVSVICEDCGVAECITEQQFCYCGVCGRAF